MFKQDCNCRLQLVFLFFILILSLLITRLIYIQVFKSAQFKVYALEQHRKFSEIQPQRGTIFDRNLKPLAIDAASYSIFASKEFLPDQKTIARLANTLDLNQDNLASKFVDPAGFVWLKRKVNPALAQQIEQLNIPGIDQIRENKRFYPNGSLACHILGFTDIDSRGLEGLEFLCDSYLSGIKGWRLAHRDAKRRELICWGYKSIAPTDGYNLVLTIDSVIQAIAERHLRKAAQKYKAISASAVVLEPKSGEILALYNYPDYDLNNFIDYQPQVRRNLAITDIFEPGSSFKFVTAAAALEEQQVKLDDQFFCENGKYRTGGRTLHDYKPYGNLTFEQVIVHSSNIGTAKVAQRLGEQQLYRYIKNFGFGRLTEIALPGEVKGIVRPPQQWSRLSLSSIPMGQEVAVTPIQLIMAMACLANDGILVKPKILKVIQDADGTIIKSFPDQQVRRVISRPTAAQLKQVLSEVVESGTGKKAKVYGYLTAGKTGTAQKAKPQGGYYKRKYVASFVGFVPADNPAIAILVVLNEPRPQYFGGTVAAPVFKKIATETLRYLKMSGKLPEEKPEDETASIN